MADQAPAREIKLMEQFIREFRPEAKDVSYVTIINEDAIHWMVDDETITVSGLELLQNDKPYEMRALIGAKLA